MSEFKAYWITPTKGKLKGKPAKVVGYADPGVLDNVHRLLTCKFGPDVRDYRSIPEKDTRRIEAPK